MAKQLARKAARACGIGKSMAASKRPASATTGAYDIGLSG